jgi:hypothetical protein
MEQIKRTISDRQNHNQQLITQQHDPTNHSEMVKVLVPLVIVCALSFRVVFLIVRGCCCLCRAKFLASTYSALRARVSLQPMLYVYLGYHNPIAHLSAMTFPGQIPHLHSTAALSRPSHQPGLLSAVYTNSPTTCRCTVPVREAVELYRVPGNQR